MLQNRQLRTITAELRFPTTASKVDSFVQFEDEWKRNYTPINVMQRAILSFGAAAISLVNPRRPELIATLGETTGSEAAKYMLEQMQKSPEGNQILNLRPRINSSTVDLAKLESYPEGTLGKTYSNFLIKNNVTPDSRSFVQYVDDVNLAYVIQRYREVHDLFHTVLGMPTNMLGEVTVKWVEAIQTRLPMCMGGALFGAIRLHPKQRRLYKQHYLPWAIHTGSTSKLLMNIFFERRWEQPISELQKEMGIIPLNLPKTK